MADYTKIPPYASKKCKIGNNLGAHMIPIAEARDEARGILDSIRRLVRSLRLFSREAEQKLDLSAAKLFVLQQLSATKPVSMKELARRTYTDQSSVSTVVSRLAEKGLVNKK